LAVVFALFQGLHNPALALSVQLSAKSDKESYRVDTDVDMSPSSVVIDKDKKRKSTHCTYLV